VLSAATELAMMAAEASPSALLVAPLAGDAGLDSAASIRRGSQPRWRFLLGLFLLGIVVFLWVFSSILTQFLYDNPDVNYPKPTALTTLSTATASIFVLPQLLRFAGCCKPNEAREGIFPEPVRFSTVMLISLNWFFCQWTFNVSLGHTALATNTLLSSTSVVWSYVFTLLLGFRRCSMLGPVCIVLALSGIALATLGPETKVDPTAPVDDWFGMSLALGSALCYGVFSNQLAMLVRPEQMAEVWGAVGISSVVIGTIMMVLGHITGLEPIEVPSGRALSVMLLNGFVGTSISDYIWAQGVLLTAPLVANISLNMTIPVSLIVDTVILRQHKFSWTSPTGALLVFSGVVVAAVDEVISGNASGDATKSTPMAELRDPCHEGVRDEPGWQQM